MFVHFTNMDKKNSVCGLLKKSILNFCKDNYGSADIDIDGIICVSFKNSFQQHIVHIHDKLSKEMHENEFELTSMGPDGQVIKKSKHEQSSYDSQSNCYACMNGRADNSKTKIKDFSGRCSKVQKNRFHKENLKLVTGKGPPPLFNSRAMGYTEVSKSGNDNIYRMRKQKLHQPRKNLQQKFNHKPLTNISQQAVNYQQIDLNSMDENPADDITIFDQSHPEGNYEETGLQTMADNTESTNQHLDNKVSREICIENDEVSQRDKVVVKLELMDSENDVDYQITVNESKDSPLEFDEENKFTSEMQDFSKSRDIHSHTGVNSQSVSPDTEHELYQEEIKFDIDSLAHNLNNRTEVLHSEADDADSLIGDISCIVTGSDSMQLVQTGGDRNIFQNTASWDCHNTPSCINDLDGSYSGTNSDHLVTNKITSSCPQSQFSKEISQTDDETPTGRPVSLLNSTTPGYKFNFHNKMFSKKLLPLQRLRQFGNTKSNIFNSNSQVSVPFRRPKINKTESGDNDQHTKEKKYHCKHCGLGFTTTGNKTRHERTTCGKSVYKCDFCQAVFSRSDSKARHMLVRHGVSVTG